MIRQYTESYSVPPSDVQAVVNARVSLLDRYIIMRTGDNQYTALIQNGVTDQVQQLVFSRISGNYSNPWQIVESVGAFDYSVTFPYYVVSNVGVGRQMDLLCWRGASAWALVVIASFVCLWVLFKGGLFRWRKR